VDASWTPEVPGRRSAGPAARLVLTVLLALVFGFGVHALASAAEGGGPVVVFMLDSPVSRAFMDGRVLGLRAEDVTHGSLVGRVVASYCRAEIISVPVEGLGRSPTREAYLAGLRTVLREMRRRPGARVLVNISLGSDRPDAEEHELIRRITEGGGLVVAAAGNDDSDAPEYPAAYPEVIAVASATPEGKSLHSNYGRHIDIAASGDITFMDCEVLPYERLRREMEAQGTSFAAPMVTAVLAYLMQHRPGLTPREAFRLLRRTARPIDDPLYRAGLLGAGVLDVYRAKSLVAPAYRFVHYVLPVCVWIVLGVFSAYLLVRWGLVGAFLTLVIWLIALPLTVLLVIRFREYLEFVGGGNVALGLAVTGVFAATGALAAAVQAWNWPKAAAAVALPFALLIAAVAAGLLGPAGKIAGAMGGGFSALCIAVALETRVRRTLRRIAPGQPGGEPEALIRIYARSLDRRVRLAAIQALGRLPGERAAEFLVAERRHPKASAEALAAMARTAPEAVARLLGRFGRLTASERDRLLSALEAAGRPETVPYLEEAAAWHPDPRLHGLIGQLRRSFPED